MSASTPGLTILALGSVAPDATHALHPMFASIEQIDLDLPPDAALADHAAALNRAIDAAAADWTLVLRSREEVPDGLAREIAQAIAPTARSWAFRIRSEPWYDGGALRLGPEEPGEIRLVHRRHSRFGSRDGAREMKVQGGVVRLQNPLRRLTFRTWRQHAGHLAGLAVPHSFVRRCLVFAANWIRCGAFRCGLRGARYLWIEAGWDSGPRDLGSSGS